MRNASKPRTKNRQTSRLTPSVHNRKPYPLTVNDEVSKQRILNTLADPYSRRILIATTRKPLSALELSSKYGIPLSTIYRRIEKLTQAQLLAAVKPSRTKRGKWFELYQSQVAHIVISSENGTLLIGMRTKNRSEYKKIS